MYLFIVYKKEKKGNVKKEQIASPQNQLWWITCNYLLGGKLCLETSSFKRGTPLITHDDG